MVVILKSQRYRKHISLGLVKGNSSVNPRSIFTIGFSFLSPRRQVHLLARDMPEERWVVEVFEVFLPPIDVPQVLRTFEDPGVCVGLWFSYGTF